MSVSWCFSPLSHSWVTNTSCISASPICWLCKTTAFLIQCHYVDRPQSVKIWFFHFKVFFFSGCFVLVLQPHVCGCSRCFCACCGVVSAVLLRCLLFLVKSMVSGPLWSVLITEGHESNVNCWASDCSSFPQIYISPPILTLCMQTHGFYPLMDSLLASSPWPDLSSSSFCSVMCWQVQNQAPSFRIASC